MVGLQIPDMNHSALVSDDQLSLKDTQHWLFTDLFEQHANTLIVWI